MKALMTFCSIFITGFCFSQTGNVGIGTAAPAAKLDIRADTNAINLNLSHLGTNANATGIKSVVGGNTAGTIRKAGEFSATGQGSSNSGVVADASGGLVNNGGVFTASGGTNNNVALRATTNGLNSAFNCAVYGDCINNNGYAGYFKGISYFSNRIIVGLNTVAENAQLTVRAPDTSYNSIFSTTANPGGNGVLSTFTGVPNFYYAFWGIAPSNSNNAAGYFSGNVTVTGTLTNPSDERLKQNVQPLSGALDKIMTLGVHTYSFRPEYNYMNLSTGKQFGYLAQNMEKVFPELVQNTVDKMKGVDNLLHYKTVNYIGMVPVLTKALQEEHEELVKTQIKVTELEKRLAALEEAINRNTLAVKDTELMKPL